VIVLKLGGSVITDKDDPESVDGDALERAAASIADVPEPLILVHGGGSFGHPPAQRYGVSSTTGTTDATAIREIHAAMGRLNDAVMTSLARAGAPALPVHPLSAANRDRAADLSLPHGQVETMLGEGFLPVLHGDVVAHAGSGATVLSGDEVVVALGEGLDVDRVGICSAVPGVLDDRGRVIDVIESYDEVAELLGDSASTDVTGGMAGKVELLADLDLPAQVFGLEDLEAFFGGNTPGTSIR
jgi:isopentenyl phosphate kinase